MRNTFTILAFFVFIACNQKRNYEAAKVIDTSDISIPKDTILNLYRAVIELPKGWGIVEDTSKIKVADATCRYTFHNQNGKLVILKYGLGAGNEIEQNVVSSRFRKFFIRNQVDTSHILFNDNPKLIKARVKGEFNISKINVSDFDAILYEPKQLGKGLFGIYIDSIGTVASNIAQLTLYAENLDNAESLEIKQVLKTLKLKAFE